MYRLNTILKLFSDRVEKFGAPFFIFGLFGVINYPLAYAIRAYFQKIPGSESLTLRGLSAVLCLGLLLKNYWPKNIQKFFPLYWYITVTISIPVIVSYLLMKNSFSLEWLVNSAIGLLVAILILDWLMCLLLLTLGTIIGYLLFTYQYGTISWHINERNIYIAMYLYAMIFLFCVLFLRNKQRFDTTVKEQLMDQVIQKTKELEKSLITKEQLLNNINHEIKIPVQIIHTLINELIKKWNETPDNKKLATTKQVSENSERLFDLATSWIDLSGIFTKQIQFRMKQHNLSELIQNITKNLQVVSKEREIDIIFNKAQEYNLIFDADRIEQVIYNICANAIKFSPSHSEIIIDVFQDTLKQNNKEIQGICVSIQDEGVGIPEEEADSIFEPFNQSERTKSKVGGKGIGLGLAIATEIINRHNGKIWATNNHKSPGSTFYFFIPSNLEHKELHEENHSHHYMKKRPLKILFVDDDKLCCTAGELILGDLGHNVKTFTQGQELLNYLKNHNTTIDLVFLDVMMPDMTGVDIIKEIKSDNRFKNIPIIVQSGIVSNKELGIYFSFKDIGFISKPYNKSIVTDEINKIMYTAAKEK